MMGVRNTKSVNEIDEQNGEEGEEEKDDDVAENNAYDFTFNKVSKCKRCDKSANHRQIYQDFSKAERKGRILCG